MHSIEGAGSPVLRTKVSNIDPNMIFINRIDVIFHHMALYRPSYRRFAPVADMASLKEITRMILANF
jgi:hypothetical protein